MYFILTPHVVYLKRVSDKKICIKNMHVFNFNQVEFGLQIYDSLTFKVLYVQNKFKSQKCLNKTNNNYSL